MSDKGTAFISSLFKHSNELLGICHVTSGAKNPRLNGLAETRIKRLSEHLKYYAKDDYTVEEVMPLIKIILRATLHSKLMLSPYKLVFGHAMPLAVPGQPISTPLDVQPTDRMSHFNWPSTELCRLHEAVKSMRQNIKMDDKARYDKTHKVPQPTWKVGEYVLLNDDSVKPTAAQVITKQCYIGPFIIKRIVHGKPDVGEAYQLVDEKTGKVVQNLLTNDRLKKSTWIETTLIRGYLGSTQVTVHQ